MASVRQKGWACRALEYGKNLCGMGPILDGTGVAAAWRLMQCLPKPPLLTTSDGFVGVVSSLW